MTDDRPLIFGTRTSQLRQVKTQKLLKLQKKLENAARQNRLDNISDVSSDFEVDIKKNEVSALDSLLVADGMAHDQQNFNIGELREKVVANRSTFKKDNRGHNQTIL